MNKMFQQESLFPSVLSEEIIRDYGILFYNKECPISHDTNHAIFTDLSGNLNSDIEDIIKFYSEKNIEPRIYYSGVLHDELDRLKPALERYGFEIGICDGTSFFTHVNESTVTPVKNMKCKRLLSPEIGVDEMIMSGADEVQEVIDSGFGGDWWKTFVNNSIKANQIHMLVGYIDSKAVTMASVNIMDGFSRIDDVKTHSEFWGRGYSSTLMDYLVKYHNSISDNVLYLYASNPAAIKVYKQVGFALYPHSMPIWTAWKSL